MSARSLAAMFPKASKSFLEANAGVVAVPMAATMLPDGAQVARKSVLAVQFEEMWSAANGPAYASEVRVCDEREWRWDYFWPGQTSVALELQGGIYLPLGKKQGGHGTADRMRNDCDKSNEAARQGIRLFKLATGQVTPERIGRLLTDIRRLQASHPYNP